MRFQKAIVVGASSGIGAELVRLLAEQGCKVVAVARRGDRLEALAKRFPEHVVPMIHDVKDIADIPAQFQEACRLLDGLDLIVYAAGVMHRIEPHEFDLKKDAEMIAVNVTGAVAWLDQAAIRFQNVRHGTIVGLGSVAGDRGRVGQPVYNATKAALATYLEALRNRLHKHGVTVVTIKPGPVDTEMTADLGLKGAMPANVAAEKILRLARKPGEHYLKITHKVIFAIIRNVPSPIFRRLKL